MGSRGSRERFGEASTPEAPNGTAKVVQANGKRTTKTKVA